MRHPVIITTFDALGTLVGINGPIGSVYLRAANQALASGVAMPSPIARLAEHDDWKQDSCVPSSVVKSEDVLGRMKEAFLVQYKVQVKACAAASRKVAAGSEDEVKEFWLPIVHGTFCAAAGESFSTEELMPMGNFIFDHFQTAAPYKKLREANAAVELARSRHPDGRIGVVTNSDRRMAGALRGHGLLVDTDRFVSADTTTSKPSPLGIIDAKVRLLMDTEAACDDVIYGVHVGDSDMDRDAAKAAGFEYVRCDPDDGVLVADLQEAYDKLDEQLA